MSEEPAAARTPREEATALPALDQLELQRILDEFRKPWPSCTRRKKVVSLLLSLRDVTSVDRLEPLVRTLLRAPERPVLLRVLLPTESAAHELGARFRGELRPAGLRHRVRDRCLLVADDVDTVDGSHQLLALAPPHVRRAVNSIVLVYVPGCFGVWDTLVRVGLPPSAAAAADELVHRIGEEVGAALDAGIEGHGAVCRQLLLASEEGRNPRLYNGCHPKAPATYLRSWQEACAAVGLPASAAAAYDAPELLVAGWLDQAE